MNRHKVLVTTSEVLYGPRWQLPIGRALGRHHPKGRRDTIDPRLVRRWYSEERPIPGWVVNALLKLLQEEAKKHERNIEKIKSTIVSITNNQRQLNAEVATDATEDEFFFDE
jgi:hypothetical protein